MGCMMLAVALSAQAEGQAPTEATIRRLVRDLADEDPVVRQAAFDVLNEAGVRVLPYIEEFLSHPDVEFRTRIRLLWDRWKSEEWLDRVTERFLAARTIRLRTVHGNKILRDTGWMDVSRLACAVVVAGDGRMAVASLVTSAAGREDYKTHVWYDGELLHYDEVWAETPEQRLRGDVSVVAGFGQRARSYLALVGTSGLFDRMGSLPSGGRFRRDGPAALEPSERIGGVLAVVVRYSMVEGGGEPFPVRLWIDPETCLPLRRQFVAQDPRKDWTTWESYEQMDLNVQVDEQELGPPPHR